VAQGKPASAEIADQYYIAAFVALRQHFGKKTNVTVGHLKSPTFAKSAKVGHPSLRQKKQGKSNQSERSV